MSKIWSLVLGGAFLSLCAPCSACEVWYDQASKSAQILDCDAVIVSGAKHLTVTGSTIDLLESANILRIDASVIVDGKDNILGGEAFPGSLAAKIEVLKKARQ